MMRNTPVHMMVHGKKMDTFTREVMVCVNLMTFYHIRAYRDEIVYVHVLRKNAIARACASVNKWLRGLVYTSESMRLNEGALDIKN